MLQNITMAQLLRSAVLVSRPRSRATGAKFAKNMHRLWPGFIEPVRRDSESCIAHDHATSRIA